MTHKANASYNPLLHIIACLGIYSTLTFSIIQTPYLHVWRIYSGFVDLKFPLDDAKNFLNKLPKAEKNRDTSAFFHSGGIRKELGMYFLRLHICHESVL